ncbi:Uncharacterized protein QTN25_005199 [Entamoeba marina]
MLLFQIIAIAHFITITVASSFLCTHSSTYDITTPKYSRIFELQYPPQTHASVIGCNRSNAEASWLAVTNKTPQILKVQMRYFSHERNKKYIPLHIAVNKQCPDVNKFVHCVLNETTVNPSIHFILPPDETVHIASYAFYNNEYFKKTEWVKIISKPVKKTLGKSIKLTHLDTLNGLIDDANHYVKHISDDLVPIANIPHVTTLPTSASKKFTSIVNEAVHKTIKTSLALPQQPNNTKKVTLNQMKEIVKGNRKSVKANTKSPNSTLGFHFQTPSTLKTTPTNTTTKTSVASVMKQDKVSNMSHAIAKYILFVVIGLSALVLISLVVFLVYQYASQRKQFEEYHSI